jgi:hypothetical protein
VLSTALTNTQQLIDTIGGLAAPPPPAAQMQTEVVQYGAQSLPALSSARDQLLAFTSQSATKINALNAEAVSGANPTAAAAALNALGLEFDQCSKQLAPLVDRLDQFRESVSGDIAAMTGEQVDLNAQLAGLAAEHDRWSSELDAINKQNSITNILSIFFPLPVLIGGEIASAIQYGKTTEGALEEANQQIADLTARAHSLGAAANACTLLSSALDQLGSAVQNLANALSLIRGDLNDDAVRAAIADSTTLRLFLISLIPAMTVLQNGAG